MDNFDRVKQFIFVEHDGMTISVGEIADGTGISVNEVDRIVHSLTEQGFLKDMEECEADDPEAKIGKVIWK